MNISHPLPDHVHARRRVVVLARKITEGRALLQSWGWPLVNPTQAPAGLVFSWRDTWAFGHPPPFLVLDPEGRIHPSEIRGADLVVEVLGVTRVRRRVVAVWAIPHGPDNPAGLAQHLRDAGAANAWQ